MLFLLFVSTEFLFFSDFPVMTNLAFWLTLIKFSEAILIDERSRVGSLTDLTICGCSL